MRWTVSYLVSVIAYSKENNNQSDITILVLLYVSSQHFRFKRYIQYIIKAVLNLLLYPFEFYSNRRPLLFFSISLNSSSNNRLITLIIFQRIKVNLNTKLAVGQNNDTYHMGVDLFMERGYPPFTIGGGRGRKKKARQRPIRLRGGLTSLPYPFRFPSHWANTSTFYQAWMLRWFITVSLTPPSYPSLVFFQISQTEALWVYKNSWGEGSRGVRASPTHTPPFCSK